ncbi:MAG: DUF1573 domain-containing protein [Planctomycetota bacterium]|nr:DUF1573 domain-containing protein [Planctomycetaceae bacterium]MDQ3331222.1 DUF1573 domain-containing protein [Planctomycetota bacterium]
MKVRPAVVRAAAVAAVLAPFSMSVIAHAVGDTMSQAKTAERPALAFREYMLNLGRVPEGRPVPARFWFTNTGDAPLTILDFKPSCGCLTPQLDKRDFAPGEQGTFVVVADTAGTSLSEKSDETGNLDQVKQHFVDVRYDAGDGERFERVNIKFVLPARRVTVEPRSLLVYQFNDQPTDREIVVTDRRSPPITVTKVECLSGVVSVASEIADASDDPTRARLAITIPAPRQSLRTLVTIHTNDPDQPRIHVPIIVQVPENRPTPVSRTPLDLVPRNAARR